MAFYVIEVTAGLSRRAKRRAMDAAPEYAATATPYRDLALEAGFSNVEIEDVTADWRRVLAARFEFRAAARAEIEPVLGAEDFADRQRGSKKSQRAASDGSLRRILVVAA